MLIIAGAVAYLSALIRVTLYRGVSAQRVGYPKKATVK